MSADEAVTRWLRQLEGRDQDAARLLWQRYYRELVELARARLGPTPRRIADEETCRDQLSASDPVSTNSG